MREGQGEAIAYLKNNCNVDILIISWILDKSNIGQVLGYTCTHWGVMAEEAS